MMVELSWPAKALSPNFRSRTYHAKARAIGKAVEEAFYATRAAMGPVRFAHEPGARLSFVITAYPPTRHARDDDNVIASLKAHRDGIAKALGVDDRYFDARLQWGEPVKGGKVVVVIGAANE